MNMGKKHKCIFCGAESEGVFCSEQCRNLATFEAEEIDRRIYFLFGKKSNYYQKKLNSMLTNHFEVLKSV
jgi:predicted nucleic acid-binding Zn ribbon protein